MISYYPPSMTPNDIKVLASPDEDNFGVESPTSLEHSNNATGRFNKNCQINLERHITTLLGGFDL